MFADPIVVSQTAPTIGTGSDNTYGVVTQNGSDRERLKSTATLTDPQKMVIKHSSSGSEKQSNLIDRHLVQFSITEHDALNVQHTMQVNLTLVVPRQSIFTESEIRNELNKLSNFVHGSGNLTNLLQGQA